MLSTSVNLLERVRQRTDAAAWDRFVRLYTPFLFYCCRRSGLDDHGAADAVQDVFVVLLDKLPSFQYAQDGSFRGWLQTVTMNKCRERQRRRTEQGQGGTTTKMGQVVDDGAAVEPWVTEYRQFLVSRALEIMQAEFEPKTWQACWQTTVEDRPVAVVAAELGLSVNAVYVARSRVLRRLREELRELLDE